MANDGRDRPLEEEHLVLHARDLEAELLPRLRGRVFHVTSLPAYEQIKADRAIKSNQKGEFGFTYPQSEFSYFRKRGCVCFFDLRTATSDEIEGAPGTLGALHKFYFLAPLFSKGRPVFLLLKDHCFAQLIPWYESKKDEGLRAMVVPYVEAGFPGTVSLDLIERVLLIEVKYDPQNPTFEALVAALVSLEKKTD